MKHVHTFLLLLVGLLICKQISIAQSQRSGPDYSVCGDACQIHVSSTEVKGTTVKKSNANSLGMIQNNTNVALPNSYNFKEYVFAEPNDQGICTGSTNATAVIEEVFLSQTHRQAVGHPLFFTIGHRPVLLQVAVIGTGSSPDVTVEGILNGNSLGTFCLAGPTNLSSSLDISVPDFNNYFSVTLPKAWIQDGLDLIIIAGNQTRTVLSQELNIGPYTEMNLVMVNMDVMDYNTGPHNTPVFDDFLEEMASSIPASQIRFGIFPETLVYPEVIASDNTETLVRLQSKNQVLSNPLLDDGHINSIAVLALANMQKSTHDYLSTVYFGNTLNLAPGGWGGGKSFVSFDFTDVFIHELGHALSLPHWGNSYDNEIANMYEYNYPYGGETGNGGGRGQTWNFIQDSYEFVSPTCSVSSNPNVGLERSDCMQRNHPCLETRPSGNGPWDGHGLFSAHAMHRYMVGASVTSGQVMDRGALKDFQLNVQNGFPNMKLVNGEREYTRDPSQPQSLDWEESRDMPGEEILNTDVYLIYGTAHPTQVQGNIVYKPVKFNGTLPPVIDPTDPALFDQLKFINSPNHLHAPRDLTIKVTYEDGTLLHALNPFHSYARQPYLDGFHVFRYDLSNFSLVVPADKDIQKVEVYERQFCVRNATDNTAGNINFAGHNITAANFMNDAVLLSEYEYGQTVPATTTAFGNRVWHDYDRDGINDPNELGIAGVSVAAWRDPDGDGIPDGNGGFMGSRVTDENGNYSFSGLAPGVYSAFVWQVNNWGVGEPLHGFMSTEIFEADPNTDIDLDNSGTGLPFTDIFSGIIHLTLGGEPLNDGDPEDCWFDTDGAGNMTIDFGFYDHSLYVWIGPQDTEWDNPANWAGGVVPDANSDVLIPPDRPFYPIVVEDVEILTLCTQLGARLDILADCSFDILAN